MSPHTVTLLNFIPETQYLNCNSSFHNTYPFFGTLNDTYGKFRTPPTTQSLLSSTMHLFSPSQLHLIHTSHTSPLSFLIASHYPSVFYLSERSFNTIVFCLASLECPTRVRLVASSLFSIDVG